MAYTALRSRNSRSSAAFFSKAEFFLGDLYMEITKKTLVSDILKEHGDIADVMELFGVKRVAGFSIRKFLSKVITVERAAKVHGVPLPEFIEKVQQAVNTKQS